LTFSELRNRAAVVFLFVLTVLGGDPVSADSAEQLWLKLQKQSLRAQKLKTETAKVFLQQNRFKLHPWYHIGPFKDEVFGNERSSFAHVFPPEADILQAKYDAPLKRKYRVRVFPGMLDNLRKWTLRPDWTDGYRHQLPRGPAPSRNETTYLYRIIEVAGDVRVKMQFNAEDAVGVWLNGVKVKHAWRRNGPSRFPTPLHTPLDLKAGRNRLLLKITSIHAAHGFAFGLEGVTPTHPLIPGAIGPDLRRSGSGFYPGNTPYFSEGKQPPMTAPAKNSQREAGIAAFLGIAVSTVKEICKGSEAEDLAEAWRNAAIYARRLKRLRKFKSEVTSLAMYDPPVIKMESDLKNIGAPSKAGQEYTAALKPLAGKIDRASAMADRGSPQAFGAVSAAHEKLEEFWATEIGKLSPIIFIRCPQFSVNAVRPYDSGGSTPASICVWDPSNPRQLARVVFHETNTRIFDMNLSFDARTVFFSARRPGAGSQWHIYEIGIDGKGLKQITSGNSRNISPCQLPSGDLVFVSTRANNWVTCQGGLSGVLFSCRRDGSQIRKLSANIDSDHTPQVLHDGRVMFTRWDYGVEKNVFARHALWAINPDGTGLSLLFGNTIEDPAGFWQARPIPGRPEIVCTFGPHHAPQAGMIGLIWNGKGTERPRGEGFRFVTDEVPSFGDHNIPHSFQDPFPVNRRQFLVSYGGDGQSKNRIYLMDDRGNRKCVYEAAGNLGCFNPQLLKARPLPPVIPVRCSNPEWKYRDPFEKNRKPNKFEPAVLMVQDVTRGVSKYVKPGEARYLRVMEQLQKTTRHLADAWGTSPVTGRGTVHVRRVLGLVPIEKDGSAMFQVPSLRNISLNLLDAEGKMLMRMGSDMHLMPGESRSCIGCHEVREGIQAPSSTPKRTLAMRKPVAVPKAPDWGTGGLIDYQKVIQPIWDKYCLKCHSGSRPKGGVDMTGGRTRYFCVSYDNLIEREVVEYHNVFALDHDENTPKTLGSYVSRISQKMDAKHCKKQVSAAEKMRVYAWIDANVPYYSTYRFTRPGTRGSRDLWCFSKELYRHYDKRCMDCHKRQVVNSALYGSAATISSSIWTNRGITAHGFPFRWPETAHIGPELRINISDPSHSLILQAPLAKKSGGLGMCRSKDDESSIFKDKTDPTYRLMLRDIEAARKKLIANPRVDISPSDLVELKARVLMDTAGRLGVRMLADKDIIDIVSRGKAPMPGPGAKSGGPWRRVRDWLRVCGEAVYGTKPFDVPGEGPHAAGAGAFDASGEFTHKDMSFRRNSANTVLYAIAFGWPGDRAQLNIATLNSGDFDSGTITSITMIGVSDRLAWRQDSEGLKVTMPSRPSYGSAYPLKIAFKGSVSKLDLPVTKNDTDASITYSGSWKHHSLPDCYDSDETFTVTNGDHAVITFKGASISILSRVHPRFGTFKVYIDGKAVADVNTCAPQPASQQRVYIKTGLSNRPHTLKIVKTSGGYIGIDGYEVSSK
jgi:hypothetical protein